MNSSSFLRNLFIYFIVLLSVSVISSNKFKNSENVENSNLYFNLELEELNFIYKEKAIKKFGETPEKIESSLEKLKVLVDGKQI